MGIAYLTTQYPAISHTFVDREVRQLRSQGVDVHTFSVRLPHDHDLLSDAHREAHRTTTYLLASKPKMMLSQLPAFIMAPAGYFGVMWRALLLSPEGLRNHLLYLVYAMQGVVLARHLKERGIAHVHVHLANNGAAVAMLACAYDPSLTYSLTIHGSSVFFAAEQWRLKEKAENAAFVRCISNFTRAQVMFWTDPVAWEKFHVVHCGVDTKTFSPRPDHANGPLRLITVGRLDPIKGYLLLLDALKRLDDMVVGWHLNMIGDGDLMDKLRAQSQRYGLADQITFTGAIGQDRLQDHLIAADVMIISSFMEGLPVVLMEAMSSQLAVISTNVAGVAELVEHDRSGLVVPAGSAEALADAIRELATDRTRMNAMGRHGRKKVVSEFSVELAGRQMVELFRHYAGDAVLADV